MAAQPQDNVTQQLFNGDDKEDLKEAMSLYIASISRKREQTRDANIKRAYEHKLNALNTLKEKIK